MVGHSWTWTIALTALVASIVASASVVVASADARSRPAACLTRFFVDRSEDFGADGDEPYLKVNTVFWRAPGSMDNGSRATVGRTCTSATR